MKIVWPILIVLVIGGLLGLILAFADKYLSVKEDERIKVVTSMLPGANCGGCGYPGCSGMAEALVTGKCDNVSNCKPSKLEARQKIQEYLKETPGPDGQTVDVKV